MKKDNDGIQGVWRTISGRRVFIKDGQDLATAMRESGKFKNIGKNPKVDRKKNKYATNNEGGIDDNTSRFADEAIKHWEKENQKYKEKYGKDDEMALKFKSQWEKEKSNRLYGEKSARMNETMDRRQAIIERLDKETKDLSSYDRYNLAISKLENEDYSSATERQYWVGEKERYEKSQNNNNHSWSKDEKGTTYGYKNQYGYTINQLQIDDDAKEYRVGSFTQSNDKKLTRKNFHAKVEELENAGYKKVDSWSERKSVGSNTSNINEEKSPKRTTDQINKEYETLSKKMQQDDYYYKPEDDRKLKELRAEYDTEVARGQKDVNLEEYNKNNQPIWQDENVQREVAIDTAKSFGAKEVTFKGEKIHLDYSDYLPKAKKVETAGTSNRKEVSDNIQAHILDYYDNPVDFMEQMDAMDWLPTRWHAGQELAKGGSYAIYYDDQRKFLDDLNINPKGKKFSDDRVFEVYTSLIGRESERLYNRLEKLFDQYKKEHKNSNATLDDFRKWFK